jgi:hypothetical protein
MLKSLVIAQVEQIASKNYRLELGKIEIGWWALNAHFYDVKFSKVKNSLSSDEQFFFILKASHIKIKGIQLYNLLFNHQIEIKKLSVFEPIIQLNYNDTIVPKLNTDGNLQQFNFKISDIELKNAKIKIIRSSGSVFNLKSKRLTYKIKQSEIFLEKVNMDARKKNERKIDITFNISAATLQGINLNGILNGNAIHYKACHVDSMKINWFWSEKHISKSKNKNDTIVKDNKVAEFIINPIYIKHIHFLHYGKNGTTETLADDLKYKLEQLQLNNFAFTINQQSILKGKIDGVNVLGFNVSSFIETHHGYLKEVSLINPSINLNYKSQKATNADLQKEDEFLLDSILHFNIKNGSFSFKNDNQKNLKFELNAIGLIAKNVHPQYWQNKYSDKLFTDISLHVGASYLNLPNNRYHFNIQSASYNLRQEMITVNGFGVSSNYKKNTFHSIVKKQIAMLDLKLKKLSASAFNLIDLIRHERFICNSIYANQLVASFYKDKNIPLLESDYKKFPQELIHDLKFPFEIKSVHIAQSELISELLNPGSKNIARISVNNVKANFYNINNKKYSGNQLKVDFEGKIANSGLLQANANLDMYSSEFNHSLHAQIGTMPFNQLNEFMFDFAGVEIKNGILNKAVFDIIGNRKKMTCAMELSYHDLNMVILRNQNKKHKRYRNIASILANVFIYNHNPEPGKPLRKALIEHEIETNRFIINNWITASLKAMLVTTAPTAASALQLENLHGQNPKQFIYKKPNILSRFIEKKRRTR